MVTLLITLGSTTCSVHGAVVAHALGNHMSLCRVNCALIVLCLLLCMIVVVTCGYHQY